MNAGGTPAEPLPLDECQKLADAHREATGHSIGEVHLWGQDEARAICCLECTWEVSVERE